ncbi:unnamed protein product [Amaranthus hypochondriacus]
MYRSTPAHYLFRPNSRRLTRSRRPDQTLDGAPGRSTPATGTSCLVVATLRFSFPFFSTSFSLAWELAR